jgi:uncharacterized protein with HEPN domain
MSDTELLEEILTQILEGIQRIERRSDGIQSADDFVSTNEGVDRLDAIGMMLVAIGECIKNFERTGGKTLMDAHPEVDWKGAKGMRDFLSHHYFDLDAEVVFAVCRDHIDGLKRAVIMMRNELNKGYMPDL